MKRRQHGFGPGAIIVEALGAMLVLYLLFPGTESPRVTPAQVPQVSSASVSADRAQPLPPHQQAAPQGGQRDLPVLSLPAPPRSTPEADQKQASQEQLAAADESRRQFVEAELEYSRSLLIGAVKRHLQSIAE